MAERTDQQRKRDRDAKRQARAKDSTIILPACEDIERRTRLESDDVAWLLHYFGPGCELDDPFWYDFVAQQKSMIAAISHAITYGDDQAIAASRGEGKTTLSERLLLKKTLQGVITFSVLMAATGTMADNSLDSIKTALEWNPLLEVDYPEVCVPVKALEGAPQRANTQRVSGKRHDNGEAYEEHLTSFKWSGQEIIFPDVPGSPSAKAIIATRGLDAAVRGLRKRGKRPQLAVIDDPDTEDTARSEDQAEKLEARIDAAIAGLGGQQRGIGRVMLTTLQSRIAVSYKFTDPQDKPSFRGKRYRFLVTPPDRVDLWDEYVQLRIADLQKENEDGTPADPFARRAHQMYLDNIEIMNAGAVVSNPHRYNPTTLPDGTQVEVSALQHYYNMVAKIGPVRVATEYDNDPPEETGVIESGLNASRIQKQLNGMPRKIVPDDCQIVTQGIDCGKVMLHWVARAWGAGATGHTIDYGTTPVHGTVRGSDEGLDVALKQALKQRFFEIEQSPYIRVDGSIVPVSLTLIDAGYRTDAIYEACAELGVGVMPAMGFGKSHGCVGAYFPRDQQSTSKKYTGEGWAIVQVDQRRHPGIWRVNMDADQWKLWEHDRWMTDVHKPGTMFLYGDNGTATRLSQDERDHMSYAKQMVSEKEAEQIVRGKLVRGIKQFSDKNHWLDASYMSNVAANIRGVRLVTQLPQATQQTAKRATKTQRRQGTDNYLITER